MNQRLERIGLLAPFLQPCVKGFIEQVTVRLGIILLVTNGFRSADEQRLIYQQGRTFNPCSQEWEITDEAAVKTKAKPGQSAHNVVDGRDVPASLAVDVIPLHTDGTINWTPTDEVWKAIYAIAWEFGLDPLGDKTGAYYAMDKGHFEEPNWRAKLSGFGYKQPSVL